MGCNTPQPGWCMAVLEQLQMRGSRQTAHLFRHGRHGAAAATDGVACSKFSLRAAARPLLRRTASQRAQLPCSRSRSCTSVPALPVLPLARAVSLRPPCSQGWSTPPALALSRLCRLPRPLLAHPSPLPTHPPPAAGQAGDHLQQLPRRAQERDRVLRHAVQDGRAPLHRQQRRPGYRCAAGPPWPLWHVAQARGAMCVLLWRASQPAMLHACAERQQGRVGVRVGVPGGKVSRHEGPERGLRTNAPLPHC